MITVVQLLRILALQCVVRTRIKIISKYPPQEVGYTDWLKYTNYY